MIRLGSHTQCWLKDIFSTGDQKNIRPISVPINVGRIYSVLDFDDGTQSASTCINFLIHSNNSFPSNAYETKVHSSGNKFF